MKTECEVAIVGGGMVGSALGYGLARAGAEVMMLDQGDRDLRAARGNFGLLWVQGKGADCPEYAHWTLLSSRLWPGFAEELQQRTGIDVQYRCRGGIHYCLDDRELEDYSAELAMQASVSADAFQYRMLDASELKSLEPNIASNVPGGGYSPHDGHVNPLLLLRAMQAGFVNCGGQYRPRHSVQSIEPCDDGYRIRTEQGEVRSRSLVLAAGLDNRRLAPMLGLKQPLHPQRGQLLITERLPPLLNHPSVYLRQTGEGTIQIGDSSENSGLDDSNTVGVMAELAARAVRLLPALQHRRIVRGWGALRVLSPDGYPIYEQASPTAARAFAFSCHSGVTLAAAHALRLAPMLLEGGLASSLAVFSSRRFQD